jgi:hypothetical protein
VLAWGLVYLLLIGGPLAARMAEIQPTLATLFDTMKDRAASGTPPDFTVLRGLYAHLFQPTGLLGLSMLGQLLGSAVLTAAIYRAVLEPEKKSFASLRLGAQELWLALLNIVACIVLVLAGFVITIAAGVLSVVAAIATQAMSEPAHTLIGILLGAAIFIGAVAAFLLICVRLSMAGPLTFAERQFRLFESWTLTKGHGWKLFGLALLLVLVCLGLEIAVAVIGAAVGFSLRGAVGFNPMKVREMLFSGLWPPSPWLVATLVVKAIVATAFLTIFVAPWATAFRELGGNSKREHPAVF